MFVLVQILQNIPTCENLPPTSDDSSCVNLDQIVSNIQNGKKIIKTLKDQWCLKKISTRFRNTRTNLRVLLWTTV
jgi:hypothetical protein